MRWGVAQALHHARHRCAFGKLLADQPLMQNVLADLAIESEAATAAAMRVARAYDEGDAAVPPLRHRRDEVLGLQARARHAIEALECLGGNGYVEESGMPRLFRDSPLNSIWEGSGNVAALDVLRAIVKEPEALPAFLAECELGRGGNAALDAHLDRVARDAARRTPSSRRAASSRTWRWRSRRACSCATRRPRSRTPSAPRGSPTAAAPTARCRRGSTPRRSSAARSPLEHAALRGDRPRGADHARPARARQRDHARDAARAGGVRRAGEPRPGRPRDRAGGQRQGLLRRLRPRRVAEHAIRPTTTRTSPGTRWSTGR